MLFTPHFCKYLNGVFLNGWIVLKAKGIGFVFNLQQRNKIFWLPVVIRNARFWASTALCMFVRFAKQRMNISRVREMAQCFFTENTTVASQ